MILLFDLATFYDTTPEILMRQLDLSVSNAALPVSKCRRRDCAEEKIVGSWLDFGFGCRVDPAKRRSESEV